MSDSDSTTTAATQAAAQAATAAAAALAAASNASLAAEKAADIAKNAAVSAAVVGVNIENIKTNVKEIKDTLKEVQSQFVPRSEFNEFKNDSVLDRAEIKGGYVKQESFEPIKKLVYGCVSIILTAFVGAIVALVIIFKH